MTEVRHAAWIAMGSALLIAACSPPLAATPTAVPSKPAATQAAPAGAAAPTTAPAEKTGPAPAATAAAAADDELGKIRTQYYEAAKREGKVVIHGGGSPD